MVPSIKRSGEDFSPSSLSRGSLGEKQEKEREEHLKEQENEHRKE